MEDYYYEKLLQAICFTNDTELYLNEKILDPMFLTKFKRLLVDCNHCAIINYKMKDNLLDVTQYLRYNGYQELANEFIILINRCDVNCFCWQNFLNDEIERRKMSKTEKFNGFIEDLFYSLEMDFWALQFLLCDDKSFENQFVEIFMLDEFYFISCKIIKDEFQELFDDKKVIEKVYKIHLCNKEMKKEIGSDEIKNYRKILKTGKKVIKKVIK